LLAVASYPVWPVTDGAALRVTELLKQLCADWRISLVAPPGIAGFDTQETGVADFSPVKLDAGWTYMPYQHDPAPLVWAVSQKIEETRPAAALLWSGSEFLALGDAAFPPVVADRIDCVSLTAWRAVSEVGGWRERLGRLDTLRRALRYERLVSGVSHTTIVVGEDDARWLRRITRATNVDVVPNGVHVDRTRTFDEEAARPTVVFTGVMDYPPNVDAAKYFAEEVWLLVRAAVPEARFLVAGRSPAPDILALAALDGVEVTGEVPDLAGLVARAWVSVAPMQRGSGIKNKVLEAWAVGTPVVMSSIATNGLRRAGDFPELVADDPTRMAEAVVRLLRDPGKRHELGRRVREAASAQSWEAAGRSVSRLLADASGRLVSRDFGVALG
jgi:glycosyltransferase involved in cell wall biosynthesis